MTKDRIRTDLDALYYMTECTLATVAGLFMRKSASKAERERHVSIAQTGYDWLLRAGYTPRGRLREVEVHGGSVQRWATQFLD